LAKTALGVAHFGREPGIGYQSENAESFAMSASDRYIMTIFGEALERKSPQERAAYLDDACSHDGELRARVEALLRSEQEAGKFLQGDSTASWRVSPEEKPLTEGPGTAIGPYRYMVSKVKRAHPEPD
jgi:hypothetical protein